MRHVFFILIMSVAVWLAGCSHSSYTVEQVDVRAYIFPDGDVYIEELFTYDIQGEYGGMERSLELLGHEGVSFFEAYIPPEGKVLGEFSYEEAKRLDVTYSKKHSAYFTSIGADNEKMRVYYRYRLEEVAARFEDRGEFDWNFFVFQNSDLHNVTIETFWPRVFEQTDVSMFAYNRNSGKFTDIKEQSIVYKSDFISEYETLALHYLFPSDHLGEMKIERTLVSKTEKVKQETERQQSYEKRESRLAFGEQLLSVVLYMLSALLLIILLPVKTLLAKQQARLLSLKDMEQLHPVLLSMLYRKGSLKVQDFVAGLFALEQAGTVTVERRRASVRFQEEELAPNETFTFIYTGNRKQEANVEKRFIDWLFRKTSSGNRTFSLSSMAGPLKSERRQKKAMKKYHRHVGNFHARFHEWREEAEKKYGREQWFIRGKWLTYIIIPLVLLHFFCIMYLYIADAKSWLALTGTAVVLGGGVFIAARHHTKKKWSVLYFVTCFFIGAQIQDETVVNAYMNSLMISLLLVALLPKVTLSMEATVYREAVRARRRTLKKGGYSIEGDSNRLLIMIHHAILLGVGKSFAENFRQKFSEGVPLHPSPLFAPDAAFIIDYTTDTLKEIPEEKKKQSSEGSSDGDGGWGWDWSSSSDGDSGGSDGGGGD